MRPINLIPPEQRRGRSAPLRSGPIAYIVVGALVAALVGVAALVLTGNQISDRKSDLAELKVEDARLKAKARHLAAFTQFHNLREQRVATVTTLANSRFDWERVMRELALILPHDVWLVKLTATATPAVEISTSEGSGSGSEMKMRDSAPGPALELEGCAKGQEAVAGFITALKEIDGVTRVGVESSELPSAENGAGSVGESGGGGDDCRTREFIAKFEIVVAFDAAPIPIVGSAEGEETAVVAPAPPAEEESSSESSEEGEEG